MHIKMLQNMVRAQQPKHGLWDGVTKSNNRACHTSKR
jgi:hypothetical protein